MFSIILSIVAIVLVALIVVASLYYGGNAWNSSGASAAAATLINQSSQIQGAIEAYKSDNAGQVPASMSDLLNNNYLNAAPFKDIYDRWISSYAAPAMDLLARLKRDLEEGRSE